MVGDEVECRWWLSQGRRKVAVAPESRMAVGGLGALVDEWRDKEDKTSLFLLSLFVTGPDRHSIQKQLRVEPPCMFVNVALVLCPGAGF